MLVSKIPALHLKKKQKKKKKQKHVNKRGNSDRKTPQEHLADNKSYLTGTPRYVMPGIFCFFYPSTV